MPWPRSQPGGNCAPTLEDAGLESADALLVAAAQADRRAFAALYRRYAIPIYRYCYTRLGECEAAEDATGEVFTKALAAFDRYHDGAFAAWLFRIAHNVVVDQQRRRRPLAPLDAANERAHPDRGPDDLAIARDTGERVRAALAQLPVEQRAAIELAAAGWSGQQIADALCRSTAAVKMLRFRAMGRLRALLTAAGMDPSEARDEPR